MKMTDHPRQWLKKSKHRHSVSFDHACSTTGRRNNSLPELWENGKWMPSWRRSNSGLMKGSILITHENCEGSISSTLRTRNLRRPSRMLARNWKHQWLLLCPAKLWRTTRNCASGASNKTQNKTCVYSGSLWIYRTAYGRIIADSSWRPYCRKRRQVTAA